MRYIFYTLVLVNIGYLGYALFLRLPVQPPVTLTSPGIGAKRIYLLSEKQPDISNIEQLNSVINNPIQQAASSPASCQAIGPFDDIFSGQSLVHQLQALNIDTELRAFDQPTGKNDYRVLIPPAPSLQAAFRKLRELKSRNINSYVITQGKHALGISLGVFSDAGMAKKLQTIREKQGYKVEVASIPRYSREFWVFSTEGPDLKLAPGLWQSLVSEHTGLERKGMPCPIHELHLNATKAPPPNP